MAIWLYGYYQHRLVYVLLDDDIYTSIRPYVYMSICLYVYMSICLYGYMAITSIGSSMYSWTTRSCPAAHLVRSGSAVIRMPSPWDPESGLTM